MVKHLKKETFENDVLKSDKLVLVDFFAEWCTPCQIFAPIFERMSNDYEGKVDFCKMDVQDNDNINIRYNLTTVPTLVFFKNGEKIHFIEDYVEEKDLKELIEKLI